MVIGSAKPGLLGDVSKGLRVSGDGAIIASNANGSGHARDKELEARLAIGAEAKAKDTRSRYYSELKATFTLKKHPQEQWVFGHRMHVLTVKNGAIAFPFCAH